jgi:hypothetical protein
MLWFGFASSIAYEPKTKTGVVVLSNAAPELVISPAI